jgi:hypothetical protein
MRQTRGSSSRRSGEHGPQAGAPFAARGGRPNADGDEVPVAREPAADGSRASEAVVSSSGRLRPYGPSMGVKGMASRLWNDTHKGWARKGWMAWLALASRSKMAPMVKAVRRPGSACPRVMQDPPDRSCPRPKTKPRSRPCRRGHAANAIGQACGLATALAGAAPPSTLP